MMEHRDITELTERARRYGLVLTGPYEDDGERGAGWDLWADGKYVTVGPEGQEYPDRLTIDEVKRFLDGIDAI